MPGGFVIQRPSELVYDQHYMRFRRVDSTTNGITMPTVPAFTWTNIATFNDTAYNVDGFRRGTFYFMAGPFNSAQTGNYFNDLYIYAGPIVVFDNVTNNDITYEYQLNLYDAGGGQDWGAAQSMQTENSPYNATAVLRHTMNVGYLVPGRFEMYTYGWTYTSNGTAKFAFMQMTQRPSSCGCF